MKDFVLVDLYSQADAVARFTQGWSAKDILDWMSTYGEVRELSVPFNDRAFSFTSVAGVHSRFRFTQKDEIIILLDNTTYRPKYREDIDR